MTKPAAKPENTVAPFKIIGQLIGAIRSPKGEIIGEKVLGEIAIYSPDFGRVEELIAEAIAETPIEP
jgi:hypothetical protein